MQDPDMPEEEKRRNNFMIDAQLDAELVSHGVKAVVLAAADHVDPQAPLHPQVEEKMKKIEAAVLAGEKDYLADAPVTEGYRKVIASCGRSVKKNPPTVPDFVHNIQHRGKMPHINTIVDIYNMETLISGFAIGGHDLDKIHGPLVFTIHGKEDSFTSIGGSVKHVSPQDYVYRDDNGIIAWLGVRDSEFYKMDEETTRVIFVIAGNEVTSVEDRLAALERIHQDLLLCMPDMTFETQVVRPAAQ